MRTSLLLPFLALLPALMNAAEGEARPLVVNAFVSSTKISLNEPVRVEFTTMPRNVENVDIAASVTNSLHLSEGSQWRLLSGPIITETLSLRANPRVDPNKPTPPVHDYPKPVTVVFTLMPRTTGDVPLPEIPVTWLQNKEVARLPIITISPTIRIGTATQDLPKEFFGVAGVPWSAKLADVKAHLPPAQVTSTPTSTTIKLQDHLTLHFNGDSLAEADLEAPGLSLEQARTEFLKHWGVPQVEDPTTMTWYLGWTAITAKKTPDAAAGISISLVREDVASLLAHAQVSNQVFNVLDAPIPETPEQRRARDAADALAHPLSDAPAVTGPAPVPTPAPHP